MKKQLFTLCLIACLILSGCSTKENTLEQSSSITATTESTTELTTEITATSTTESSPIETTPKKYKVNKLAFELNIGDSEKIEFIDSTPDQVTFESLNTDIVSVADDGTIVAIANGSANIKCTTNLNTIVCRVLVKEKDTTKKATEPSTSKKRKKSVKKDTDTTTANKNKTTHSETTIEPETTTTSFDDTDSYEVYITNTGSKYHRGTCSYLRRSKIGISKDDAIAQGYTPCSRCHP